MSKGFIRTALTSSFQGIGDIIKWLYLSSQLEGPRLLRRVVEDARALIPEMQSKDTSSTPTHETNEGVAGQAMFSAVALILLRKNIACLQDYLQRDEEGTATKD